VITGDTKVVEKGAVDQLFINTAAIGEVLAQANLNRRRIEAGDAILVSGPIACHGLAVLVARHQLTPDVPLQSDVAALDGLLLPLVEKFPQLKFLRDPTRGGLATTLNELVQAAAWGIQLNEESLPLEEHVAALSDLLGIDPLSVANEGIAVCICEKGSAEEICSFMRSHELGRRATIIGEVTSANSGRVVLNARSGGQRIVGWPDLEQLPRIC